MRGDAGTVYRSPMLLQIKGLLTLQQRIRKEVKRVQSGSRDYSKEVAIASWLLPGMGKRLFLEGLPLVSLKIFAVPQRVNSLCKVQEIKVLSDISNHYGNEECFLVYGMTVKQIIDLDLLEVLSRNEGDLLKGKRQRYYKGPREKTGNFQTLP